MASWLFHLSNPLCFGRLTREDCVLVRGEMKNENGQRGAGAREPRQANLIDRDPMSFVCRGGQRGKETEKKRKTEARRKGDLTSMLWSDGIFHLPCTFFFSCPLPLARAAGRNQVEKRNRKRDVHIYIESIYAPFYSSLGRTYRAGTEVATAACLWNRVNSSKDGRSDRCRQRSVLWSL
ncbi:hypothetical protein BC567DRAFT_7519 [Phyllosticta citribraziliensis]